MEGTSRRNGPGVRVPGSERLVRRHVGVACATRGGSSPARRAADHARTSATASLMRSPYRTTPTTHRAAPATRVGSAKTAGRPSAQRTTATTNDATVTAAPTDSKHQRGPGHATAQRPGRHHRTSSAPGPGARPRRGSTRRGFGALEELDPLGEGVGHPGGSGSAGAVSGRARGDSSAFRSGHSPRVRGSASTRAGPQRTSSGRGRSVARMASPEVRNDTDAQQYSLVEDGEVIGFAAVRGGRRRDPLHPHRGRPAHRGGGHASILVQHALDDVREGTRRVVPLCSYVKAWIERHPDYQELTTPSRDQ